MSDSSQSETAGSPPASKSVDVVINENTLANISNANVRSLLLDRINPDFGLLEVLLKKKVLSRNECLDVKGQNRPTTYARNERLLELVEGKQKFQEFFEALRDSNQGHLVNYVTANGERTLEYSGVWPLTSRETDILDDNQEFFIDTINMSYDELVNKLYEVGFLNRRQRNYISELAHNQSKIETLLDILNRSSLRDYWKMIVCLQATNQSHVAEILQDGGIAVPIRNVIDGEVTAVNRDEEELVSQIQNLLVNRSLDESIRLLEMLQLRLYKARRGKSVVLYILCKTLDELLTLFKLFDSGELKRRIERFFGALLSRSDIVLATSTLPKENLEKYKKYFEAEPKHKAEMGEEILAICKDIKIEKCTVREEEEEEEEEWSGEEFEEEKITEQSSERDFTSEAEERHEAEADLMKVGVLQSSALASRTAFEILAAILRNNFDYFVEFIVPKGLIDRLHAEECITDEETRYIKTLTNDRDKNDEIVKCVRGVLEKYDVFVDILREKNQYRIAEVAEKGGAVMRVSITFKKQLDSEKIQEKLSERIHGHLSKAGPFQTGVVTVMSLLARARIEIVEAKSSRNLLLWLWCRSEDALKKFDKMNESQEEELSKFFGEFFALLLDGEEHILPILSIDLDDPDRDVVLRPRGFTLEGTLASSKHSVCAVTSHEDDIYVLSKNPNAILIFTIDDVNVRKTVPISDVKDPVDLVAVSEFIYVSDAGNSCIWEISAAHDRVTSWMQSVGAPYTMSLMEDGKILKASQGQPSTLDVYDTGSKKLSKLRLPSSIQFPWHAAGTSAKTFVVSYGEKVGVPTALCEVNSDGDIMNLFDLSIQPAQIASGILNRSLFDLIGSSFEKGYPCLFALNEQDEVFAIDRSNAGILVYSSRLMLEAIHGKHSIKNPSNIHYMKSKNLLLVVHGESESAVVILRQKWS